MKNYTKGLLTPNPERPWELYAPGGEKVATTSPHECSPGMSTGQANAARLAACWNAFDGIDDPSTMKIVPK